MARSTLSLEDVDQLLERLSKRDRRALSRLMTAVDEGRHLSRIREGVLRLRKPTLRVGVTGAAGAGKSTLCGALLSYLRKNGQSVCVLACDPTSPFTGGALLGDRVRMDYHPADEDVFVRSFSSHGSTGGLSATSADLLSLAEAFGFSAVLLETVGAGQDQIAARELVDVLVVLITPAGGDDIQWEKAGLMEAADVIAVNKADLAGSDATAAGLTAMLGLSMRKNCASAPPIVKIVASKGDGIEELWKTIVSRASVDSDRRDRAVQRRVLSSLQERLADWFLSAAESDEEIKTLLSRFADGSAGEQQIVDELIHRLADSSRTASANS